MTIIDQLRANPQFPPNRLASLYSDFRRFKVTNEVGYAANMAAWKDLLLSALKSGQVFDDTLCIKANNTLLDSLSTPEHGVPLALDAVIDELVQERRLIPLKEFFGPKRATWGLRPTVSWALHYSGIWDTTWKSAYKNGSLKEEKYVSQMLLDAASSKLLQKLVAQCEDPSSYTHTVYTRSMFEKQASEITELYGRNVRLSSTDLDCIIQYLTRDRVCMVADEKVIKINLKAETRPSDITEQDRAVASLRETADQVSNRVENLSARITACTDRAKKALEAKNKQVAKFALKSRRMAESTQSSSLDMLENLEQVLLKIDSASGHLEIVSALQSGVSILGNLNKAIGGAERVGELMDELKDQTADTDEIGREISRLAGDDIDDDEIQAEMAELEQQETASKLKNALPVPQSKDSEDVENLVNQTHNMHISPSSFSSNERGKSNAVSGSGKEKEPQPELVPN